MAYSADLGEGFVSEVSSFPREFRQEIEKCESVRNILSLLLSSAGSVVNAGTWNGVYSVLYTASHGLYSLVRRAVFLN